MPTRSSLHRDPRFHLVNDAFVFLLRTLPLRTPESLFSLQHFVEALTLSRAPSFDVTSILFGCLRVLDDNLNMRPSLVHRFATGLPAGGVSETIETFERCVKEAIAFRLVRSPAVQAALAVIERDYFYPHLTLAHLARGVRPSSLAAAFRRELGTTAMQHLRDVRLCHAAESLADPRRSIKEVWAGVGFGSFSAFDRAFKRRYRISPQDYRRATRPVGAANDSLLHSRRNTDVSVDARRKILVVESAPGPADALVSWLSLRACPTPLLACNGLQAIRHLVQYRPSLILTEYRLADMTGLQFLNRARGARSMSPAIILTADVGFHAASSDLNDVGAQLVYKTVAPSLLLETIAVACSDD